jgi:sulfate/thiosulfate transport system permease protein
MRSNSRVSLLLIGIVLLYLGLVLLVPFLTLLYEAFHKGFAPFIAALQTSDLQAAIRLTLFIAAIVLPINTIFGLCAAWVIARHQFPGRALLLSTIDLPFAISPVVAGLMIVLLYGRNGWFDPLLSSINFKVIFAWPGMVMATLFVTLPFVVREVIPVLEDMGTDQEDAAHTLGASDWQTFWRITLPHIRWGLLYGVLLTNARAMGEFGAVAVVSGSILGRTQTLPIFVEQAYKNYETPAAFGSAVILTLLAIVTLVFKEVLNHHIGERRSIH